MPDVLSYMIERSRFDERRLAARSPGPARAPDPRLVEEVANALFACCYLQAHGTMFVRTAAERRRASIARALRRAGLDREVARRLKKTTAAVSGFFRFVDAEHGR